MSHKNIKPGQYKLGEIVFILFDDMNQFGIVQNIYELDGEAIITIKTQHSNECVSIGCQTSIRKTTPEEQEIAKLELL